MGKLTTRQVETLREPGRHSDGDNLYLVISESGARRWVFLYRAPDGRRREMGLGSAAKGAVGLLEARQQAGDYNRALRNGIDPIQQREAHTKASIPIPTFGAFADEYIATHKSKFRNAKHVAQWESTLKTHCAGIRAKPVNTVDTEAVLSVLQPIWQQIPETASRLRGRIENILDAARVRGFYNGENPARWRGHLKAILPARQRLTRGHHAALPYDDLPAFMTDLRKRESTAALALEFCILTVTRSGETLNARWKEFDLGKALWTIPAARMKAGAEHRIPLCGRAMDILAMLEASKPGHNDHVFPGNARGKPLSNMAMAMQLKRMKRTDITVHGFRSTFRDWASEHTSFPHEVCEMALAHTIGNKAEAAYRRGDLFEKRRKLMDAWAEFAGNKPMGKVIKFKR